MLHNTSDKKIKKEFWKLSFLLFFCYYLCSVIFCFWSEKLLIDSVNVDLFYSFGADVF